MWKIFWNFLGKKKKRIQAVHLAKHNARVSPEDNPGKYIRQFFVGTCEIMTGGKCVE